jgi:hypothetical protein
VLVEKGGVSSPRSFRRAIHSIVTVRHWSAGAQVDSEPHTEDAYLLREKCGYSPQAFQFRREMAWGIRVG